MEVRTLLVVNSSTLAIYAVGLLTLVWSYPKARGMRWFMYSVFVSALSSMLMMTHGVLPRAMHFALSMALLPVSLFLRHLGFSEFVRSARRHTILSGTFAGVYLLTALWLTFATQDPQLIFKLQAAIMFVQTGLSVDILLRYGRNDNRTVRILTSAIIGSAAVIRFVWIFRHLLQASTSLQATTDFLWILTTLFAAATTFCFVSIFVSQLEHDLKEIAGTDALTGALNRRSLEIHAAREMTRCRRYGFPLSVVVMDLDHFKTLNDTHGHNAGDTALCLVVQELQGALRGTDLLCRSGGEEFLFLLPHTDHNTALHIAERLRKKVAQIAVPVEGKRVGITASLGVASWNGEAESWTAMVKRADTALYMAKNAGRNCVVTGESTPPTEETTVLV